MNLTMDGLVIGLLITAIFAWCHYAGSKRDEHPTKREKGYKGTHK